MKKLLVLLTLVVGLLGFSTGAFAQLIDVCTDCKGGTTVGSLPCPGDQVSCSPFNYQTRQGYPNEQQKYGPPLYGPFRAIFNICNCETAATSFVVGHRIGIRLTILVNGVAADNQGAYWADTLAAANIEFGMYATPNETCAAGAGNSLGFGGSPARFFGPGHYYKANGTSTATPQTNDTCDVGSSNRPIMVTTDITNGYTIQQYDVDNKLSRWWIILPSMRIDPSVLFNGETISVKIETLDQATGGICATCVATCECIIDVARVCVAGSTGACLFPYFTSTTSATADNPFWNGIAIINTGNAPGTATLTVYQQDGKKGTFTTGVVQGGSMYVAALENIGFTGAGLGDMPVYISVNSTFGSIDGFAMIANSQTGESMGYLCRKPLSRSDIQNLLQ